MAATKPAGKPGLEEDLPQVHRIRITLTSRNVKNLEKGECNTSSATAGGGAGSCTQSRRRHPDATDPVVTLAAEGCACPSCCCSVC